MLAFVLAGVGKAEWGDGGKSTLLPWLDSHWLIAHLLCDSEPVYLRVCVRVRSLQSRLPLCDSMDYTPPGFSVYGVLQAGILDELSCPPPQDLLHAGTEPVSLTYPVLEGRFFTAPPGKPMPPSLKVKVKSVSCVRLCDSMDGSLPGSGSLGFSRPEYWSGLPFPSPGDLPNPGIEARSPALQTDALPSEPYL